MRKIHHRKQAGHLVEKYKELYDDKNNLQWRMLIGEFIIEKNLNNIREVNGNSGLGLMLLGLTGDQILPADVYEKIRAYAIATVRGTVQADILKEDQAQNTCIFSTEFALRMMGDIQQYFINAKGAEFLFGIYIGLPYCRSGC
jgi:methylmalonyl-CoA mutase